MPTCSIIDEIVMDIKTLRRFAFAIERAEQSSRAMEQLGKSARGMRRVMVEFCHDIYDLCPNKRLVYLAKHGKTRRVRKKNHNRVIHIICRDDKQSHNTL